MMMMIILAPGHTFNDDHISLSIPSMVRMDGNVVDDDDDDESGNISFNKRSQPGRCLACFSTVISCLRQHCLCLRDAENDYWSLK